MVPTVVVNGRGKGETKTQVMGFRNPTRSVQDQDLSGGLIETQGTERHLPILVKDRIGNHHFYFSHPMNISCDGSCIIHGSFTLQPGEIRSQRCRPFSPPQLDSVKGHRESRGTRTLVTVKGVL